MPMSCHDRALALLARRSHFQAELVEKLRARGYSPEEVEATCQDLLRRGYLDDSQCAREFVRGRLRRGPLGRRRLTAELQRRRVSSQIIDETLDELLPEDDLEGARQVASQWRGGDRQNPSALARHLERKGFTSRVILAVLAEAEEEG